MTNNTYRHLCIGEANLQGFYPSAEAHAAWSKKPKRKERQKPTNVTPPKKKRKK